MMRAKSIEEQLGIDCVKRFARDRLAARASEIDEADDVAWDLVHEMHDLGLVGVTTPEPYGGLGASTSFFAEILEELGSVSPVMANINMAQTCYAEFLARFANEDLKRTWVEEIIAGRKIISVAMTEAGAGSDISSIRTNAVLENGQYTITGEKQYITMGLVCDAAVVFARSENVEDRRNRMSTFLVEADRDGFRRGRKEKLLGMHGEATGSIVLDNVKVPPSNRIGEAGEGFALADGSFSLGRIAIAALALGIARAGIELSAQYAGERRAFGRPIGKNQGVSFLIADNFARLEAAREIVHRAAAKRDKGESFSLDASIGKLLASDIAMKASDEAVQILGGAGYTKEYSAERFFRDAKVTQIYEGTNQIQRMMIGQALIQGGLESCYKMAL